MLILKVNATPVGYICPTDVKTQETKVIITLYFIRVFDTTWGCFLYWFNVSLVMDVKKKRYVYVKGQVKFLRNKTTNNGKPMKMFAVVGERTEVFSYFPTEEEDRFVVSLSGYYIF